MNIEQLKAYRTTARAVYHDPEYGIEVDEEANVSEACDGAWVSGWFWVSDTQVAPVVDLTPDEQFFYDHGMYSYGPDEPPEHGHVRCAKALAAAEVWARNEGYSFEWSPDHDEIWTATMRDETGEPVRSLGGVDFGSDDSRSPWGGDPYRRVVEAELALELHRHGARAYTSQENDV